MHKDQHQQRTKLSCLLLRFLVDIRPTEEVTEYTASIAYKVLVEERDAQQTVDSLKFALRAEGMSILLKKTKRISHMCSFSRLQSSHTSSDFVGSGTRPSEATVTMKYNRNRDLFTTQVEIPDFNVEAGIRVDMTDNTAEGQSITIEISNKNVPQLSLIGRAK